MIISKATFHDLQSILELQYLAFQREAEQHNDFSIQPLRQTIEEVKQEYEQGVFYKATNEHNDIIGSVRAISKGETTFIHMLIVHPTMQGRGIGTKLIHVIENECYAKRYELSASIRCPLNIKLYERLGFISFKEEKISSDNGFIYLEKLRVV